VGLTIGDRAGSIPAVALSSATLRSGAHTLPLLPSSIIWYQRKLGSKQAHRATHWPRVHGLSASVGGWLRANESEISADGPNGLGRTLLLLTYFIFVYIGHT